MLHQNFAYILEKKAMLHPGDIAIVEGHSGRAYTYEELSVRACKLANALKEAGIKRGNRVSCLTSNTVEYIDLFMASARLGAVLNPLNYRLAAFEMLRIIDDAEPKILVFDGEFAQAAKEIVSTDRKFNLALYFGDGEFEWAEKMERVVSGYPESGPEIIGDSEDPLLMLYTAGSTGKPKGVPLKQTNLFFNSINWILDVGITKRDYTLTVIPLFHIGGHMLWTLPHLIVGAKVLLQKRFEPETTLRLIEKEKVTNTYFIPAMAKMVMGLSNWKGYDLSSIRFIGAGGEAVAAKITETFAELGIPILNSYGLTETSDGTTSIRPWDATGKSANCIGKPLTLTDMRIVDPNGRDVGIGVQGEVLHRGPSVVDAYWNRPEESRRAFRDGWLYTGDLALKDEEGFVYFLGRRDDMIISGGENVYPAEVEEAILSYAKVADVAVLGVADEKWGETVKAIIAPKAGLQISEEEILDHLRTKISGFKRPRVIEFVDTLPKIGSGKLDRVQIKKLYGKR